MTIQTTAASVDTLCPVCYYINEDIYINNLDTESTDLRLNFYAKSRKYPFVF